MRTVCAFTFLALVFPYRSWCLPIETEVNCAGGSNVLLGEIDESYEGVVETLVEVPPGEGLKLEYYLFPIGVTFLELDYVPGDPNATVRTSRPLDADIQDGGGLLSYAVTCTGSGLQNTRTLTVKDINDNAPVFQQKEYDATISETLSEGSSVLRVVATDADLDNSNNRLTYTIQDPVPSVFEMRIDGLILVKTRLNYNLGSQYTFTVRASDPGDLSDTATVTVKVTDYDNMNPYFDHNLYEATVDENEVGPLSAVQPAAIKAQDGDTGINETIIYSIIAVSPSEYLSSFDINANTGVINVVTPLDREEVSTVNVQIRAAQQDDNTKTANAMVVVTVNDVKDNPPEFDKAEYSASILENSPASTFVLQVEVTDKDLGGFVGTIRLIPDTVPFTVDEDGIIRVKTPGDLDRETNSSFSFQVEAKEDDPPNHKDTANVIISLVDVNDNSPQFGSTSYEGKVFGNQTVGMLVVKVDASDPDEGVNGQVTFSITAGNQGGFFGIDENSGEITLLKLIPLEENKILQFPLYVTAKDGGDVPRASSVLVAIMAPGDDRPQFLQRTYYGSVDEEVDGPVEVVKVTFQSTGQVPQVETEEDKFSIDDKGVLSTKVKLDYETQASYTVRLSLSDGALRDEAVVEVAVQDVNDNSPVFENNLIVLDVSEGTEVGENITTVSASDADMGYNGEVRYSLQGGAGRFVVYAELGVISLVEPLDREQQSEINLEVVAVDMGRPSRSATASVIINVLDINDNEPIFSRPEYYITASERDEPGTVLITLIAEDLDTGVNAEVTYHIAKQEPTSEPPVFTVNDTSGALSLSQKLDYAVARSYIMVLEAVDRGMPALTGVTTVNVQVEDINNNPPEFSQERYDVAVPENLAGGAVLVSLEVTDKDKDGFSNGYFVMTSDTFNINKMGAISLKDDVSLDREKQDHYILQVMAVDQPVDGLNVTAEVNITVTDINDNNPEFLPLPAPPVVAEGKYTADAPGVVCQILAEDKDVGENGRVTIFTSSFSDIFSVTEDGMLEAVAELDRETQDAYDLVIIATDHGQPQRQTAINVRVLVTDVNDNPPVFSKNTYSTKLLAKDGKAGDLVLTVKATDKDAGDNSVITYSVTSGALSYLSLDGDTGEITLTSDLADVTKDTLLNLTVKAEDKGTTPLSSDATVLVDIRTVSLEEGLAFGSPTYNFSVAENEPKDTVVGAVVATSNSDLYDITYTLRTHTDAFSVDASGSIHTLVELDKETKEFYVLSVEATDTRTPPTTALTVVAVQVEDVNETPSFETPLYTAEIFSIAPFKSPVIKLKATDPDVGDTLQYSLLDSTSMFGVEPSSGQVYVVSVAGESGKKSLKVRAEDQGGLYATATMEVTVKETQENNVVVISVMQPVNIVEEKTAELEESLERVLGWTVRIISISNGNRGVSERSSHSSRSARTLISFVAMDTSGTILPAQTVRNKLKEEEEEIKIELEKVFDSEVEHELEKSPGESGSESTPVILALGILLGLSIVVLVVFVTVSVIKFRRMKKDLGDSEQESFGIKRMSQSSSSSEEDEPAKQTEEPGTQKTHRKSSQDSKKQDEQEENEERF